MFSDRLVKSSSESICAMGARSACAFSGSLMGAALARMFSRKWPF